MSGDDRSDSAEDAALDLVRFFRALPAAARREYQALASKDLEFGEDVAAERRAGGGASGGT